MAHVYNLGRSLDAMIQDTKQSNKPSNSKAGPTSGHKPFPKGQQKNFKDGDYNPKWHQPKQQQGQYKQHQPVTFKQHGADKQGGSKPVNRSLPTSYQQQQARPAVDLPLEQKLSMPLDEIAQKTKKMAVQKTAQKTPFVKKGVQQHMIQKDAQKKGPPQHNWGGPNQQHEQQQNQPKPFAGVGRGRGRGRGAPPQQRKSQEPWFYNNRKGVGRGWQQAQHYATEDAVGQKRGSFVPENKPRQTKPPVAKQPRIQLQDRPSGGQRFNRGGQQLHQQLQGGNDYNDDENSEGENDNSDQEGDFSDDHVEAEGDEQDSQYEEDAEGYDDYVEEGVEDEGNQAQPQQRRGSKGSGATSAPATAPHRGAGPRVSAPGARQDAAPLASRRPNMNRNAYPGGRRDHDYSRGRSSDPRGYTRGTRDYRFGRRSPSPGYRRSEHVPDQRLGDSYTRHSGGSRDAAYHGRSHDDGRDQGSYMKREPVYDSHGHGYDHHVQDDHRGYRSSGFEAGLGRERSRSPGRRPEHSDYAAGSRGYGAGSGHAQHYMPHEHGQGDYSGRDAGVRYSTRNDVPRTAEYAEYGHRAAALPNSTIVMLQTDQLQHLPTIQQAVAYDQQSYHQQGRGLALAPQSLSLGNIAADTTYLPAGAANQAPPPVGLVLAPGIQPGPYLHMGQPGHQ